MFEICYGVNDETRLFIASSVEGIGVAYIVQQNLEHTVEGTVWDQGVFTPSAYALESIEKQLTESDFGAFIFTPDDDIVFRKKEKKAVRDNVLFELGLFIGRLGKKRTFIVQPRGGTDFHIASDLTGLTPVTYASDRQDNNLRAALGPACNEMREAMKREGPLFQTVEQVVAELDEKCLWVMSSFGGTDYFHRPKPDVFEGSVFDQGVRRLRDLKCLRFDISNDGRQYAYHWTELGLMVKKKYGHEPRTSGASGPTAPIFTPPVSPSTSPVNDDECLNLSIEAAELLLAAAEDEHGSILSILSSEGYHLQTSRRDFVGTHEPRKVAKWKGALKELLGFLLIEPSGQKGEMFSVTTIGFAVADQLKTAGP